MRYQLSKIAAIEGRWNDEQPAGEVLIGWPDEAARTKRYEVKLPPLFGSLIDSSSLTAKETGLNSIQRENWPPVAIPFFTFRIMVGCVLRMLALAWGGMLYHVRGRLEQARWLLWGSFGSFPLGFIATLTGWFTAESGRQPWTVFGQVRTSEAVTPFLTTPQVAASLVLFGAVYAAIFIAGTVWSRAARARMQAA